jgi:enamine deaminase RidA (YjgF/YER057c/UK114 family)
MVANELGLLGRPITHPSVLFVKTMNRQLISSGSVFEEQIGYSRAVAQRPVVFVSGTTGFNYETMTIEEGVAAQAEQCLKNIDQALRKAGASLADTVRVELTYVLPNGEDFEQCWPVLKKYLGDVRPAAMMISAKLLDPRMKIEIEVTAMKRST